MPERKTPITFSIYAPEADSVAVAGSFNDWSSTAHTMRKKKDGTWTKKISLPSGRHEYQFVINGELWESDKNAQAYCPNDFGGMNAVLVID